MLSMYMAFLPGYVYMNVCMCSYIPNLYEPNWNYIYMAYMVCEDLCICQDVYEYLVIPMFEY